MQQHSEQREADERSIHALINDWVVWRDAGDWCRFATLWSDDGTMSATWFQGSAHDFIEASRRGWEKGVRIWHQLHGCSVDLAGERAIAQTKMTILQRARVAGVEVDVTCHGRFYDFLMRGREGWRLCHRQPIYERDRIDSVDPAEPPALERERLLAWPEGYRHLAYVQSEAGYRVVADLPGLTGEPVERLYARGDLWLEGAALTFEPLPI
ncbi:nuclear transport factor 2 family protein [Streptomyces asiaticus]|uniref:nuclear transport factor 2 family protein n=1 Tax=Streptomyces asiaticus TaxID=114695 RepID=UPI0037FCD761